MGVIFNYTPYTIIVNIAKPRDPRLFTGSNNESPIGGGAISPRDYSDINNYKIGPRSIIIPKDGRSPNIDFTPDDDIYICSDNGLFLGHFGMNYYKIHDFFTIYVGLVINGTIHMTETGMVPSDVDFGLSKSIDQSQFWIMLMNPYFILVLILMVIVIIITYASTCWYCLSDDNR